MSNFIKRKNRVLLIDFDFINNNIKDIYKINNSREEIIKINSNFDILCNINYLLDKRKLEINKLILYIDKLKENYNYIIIDLFSDLIFELNKCIFKKSDYILYLTGLNNLEVQKAQKNIKYITEKWKIKNESIYLVMYKYKFYNLLFYNSINLKLLFKNIKIIGKVNYSFFTNLLTNIYPKKTLLNFKNILNCFLILKNINKKE